MTELLLAPVLGFALGAWLVLAGVKKLVDAQALESALRSLSVPAGFSRHVVATLPTLEIVLGMLVSIFYNVALARILVVLLFSVFGIAVSLLAARQTHFNCGCFGSSNVEPRIVVLLRAGLGLTLALCLLLAPSSDSFLTHDVIWAQSCAWSMLMLVATAKLRMEFAKRGEKA